MARGLARILPDDSGRNQLTKSDLEARPRFEPPHQACRGMAPRLPYSQARNGGLSGKATAQGGSDGTDERNEKGTQDRGSELLPLRGSSFNGLRRFDEPG